MIEIPIQLIIIIKSLLKLVIIYREVEKSPYLRICKQTHNLPPLSRGCDSTYEYQGLYEGKEGLLVGLTAFGFGLVSICVAGFFDFDFYLRVRYIGV